MVKINRYANKEKFRHESAMLDCLLRARCAEVLASRRVEDLLLNAVLENISKFAIFLS